jgi:acyl-CoA dehydrogenase
VFLIDMRGRGFRPDHPADPHDDESRDDRGVFRELARSGRRPGRGEGRGFHYILDGMNAERTLIAAECVGDGRWFIDKAAAYARERRVFGRPIGQNQGIQFPLARAYASLRAADLAVSHAARRFESGARIGEEANIAKLLASEASWQAAEACVQTFGGFAFRRGI